MNSNHSDQIHETVVRDIVELIGDVKDSPEKWDKILKGGRRSFKSVANASSNLTAVFPVICTRNISIDSAAMVSKALERNFVSMLQMLFSAYQIDDVNNAVDYLSKFHNNIKLSNTVGIDDAMAVSGALDKIFNNSSIDERKYLSAIKEDMKNIDYYLPDNISESSLGRFHVSGSVIKEDLESDKYELNMMKYNLDHSKYAIEFEKNERDRIAAASKNVKDATETLKTRQEILKNRIVDSDVKKANELIPTSMMINFYKNDGVGDPIKIQDAMVAVKAKLYPVASDDIVNRIKLKVTDKNSLTQLIRASTRETSFWKDFVFAIDRAKIDVISNSRRGSSSKIWKVLERRATLSKFKRALGSNNDASAISTLVISSEEVEYIKTHENIDLENLSVIRPLMESLNLIGFVIVDESLEVAKFLFDTGDDMFESISFNHLERESNDNTYKKVVNLMTKVSR